MDKTLMGIVAAVASLAPMAAAQAAPTPAEVTQALNASSFAELLKSVPNAAAILEAADGMRAEEKAVGVQVAYHHHHHSWWWHHHHHHFWWHNHWYHHHHHHHYW